VQSSIEVTVDNTGRVVDSFAVDVLGPPAGWSVSEPASVSIFPGKQAVVRIMFSPPPGAEVPVGPMPFGVHVRSHEDPAGSVVSEGILDVEPVPMLSAELSPRTAKARGRRRSKHQVAIDNRGNAPALVSMVGFDEQDLVDVSVSPAELEIPPASAAFVTVRARGTHRFWFGQPQTKPFVVQAHSESAPPIQLPASLLHEAAVPGWLPKAMLAGTALVVALAALWFGLFRPVVKDTATNAAQSAVKAALSSAAAASSAAGSGTAAGAGAGAGGAGGSSSPTPSTTPVGSKTTNPAKPAPPAPVPFSVQLDSTSPDLVAAAKKQITVTDLVLQNPAADKGILLVTRDGKTLITTRLEDFRDYDLHFVTPIVVPSGSTLSMQVTCANSGGKLCTPAAFVSGMVASVSP
jgi:hypothetical protein